MSTFEKTISRKLLIEVVDTAVDHIKIMYSQYADAAYFNYAYVDTFDVAQCVYIMDSDKVPTKYVHTFIPDGVIIDNIHKEKDYETKNIVVMPAYVTEYELNNYGIMDNAWEPKTFGEKFPNDHTMFYHVSYSCTWYRVDTGKICSACISEFICEDYDYFDKIETLSDKVDWLDITGTDYVPGNGDTIYYNIFLTSEEHQKFVELKFHGVTNIGKVLEIKNGNGTQ